MRLRDYLAADRVVVPLRAESLTDAALALAERLVACGAVEHPDRLRQRIGEVRAEDVVSLADRAFLLHYRTDAAADVGVALGVVTEGVRRDAGDVDSPRAPVALLMVAPPRKAARHLQLVRGFARVLARPEVVAELAASDSVETVLAAACFAEAQLAEQLTVRDLMTERPRTTTLDTPLREAALDMMRSGLGALAVVDDERQLLGLLSERELVRHLLTTQVLADPVNRLPSAPQAGRKRVRDVMTRQVLCVGPDQPIAEVASLMSNKDVERVPVVQEGRLVGFLTRRDIVRKLLGP